MEPNLMLWSLLLVICARISGSPHSDRSFFVRSAVETVPKHDPIAIPIRSSVESIPQRYLRNYFEDDEGRLPLRDAVEKRPISLPNQESFYKSVEDADSIGVRDYFGAAHYLNEEDRFQHGNENLQEMSQTATGPSARHLVVCYLESWAAYRAPPLSFTAGLMPKSCTHLHYAFAVIHPHTYAIISANEDYDIIKGGFRVATSLKSRIPGLKVILSVGGDGTQRLFSEMVQEPKRRNSFINSAVSFLRENDFDGIDLHWVYAGERNEKEKEYFTVLLYELREKLSPYGLLLSTVLPPFRYQIEDGYDLTGLSGAVDYATLQAWDMTHGERDEPPTIAVQHATLHKDPGAAHRDQKYDNIEFMVKYILRHGMSAEKLVLGIPMFGRSYTLAESSQPVPGALVSGWGNEGAYTQTKGLLAYFEICMAEREGKGVSGVDVAGNSYAVFDNQWVSYDNPSIVAEKMKFVLSTGLAGAAAWAIDMDDFRGLCGPPYPLLNTISASLNGLTIQSDESTLKIGSCEPESSYLASDEDSCAHFHFCSGGIKYRMLCEDQRLYDPSTGFCGHQDVGKCLPGQSLRITIEEAAKLQSQMYENDYELTHSQKLEVAQQAQELLRPYTSSEIVKKNKENDKKVVCYMTSWAFYRRGDGKFVPENVDTRLCTHVVYAYASLTTDELVAKEFDPWADINNNLYERVTSLKDVKVLLGLGGWTDSAGDKYSRLVSSSASRSKFIQKLIPFLRMHNFQGLHLDWNYPVCWQSNCKKGAGSDKPNFAKFVQELSTALHAANMELGVALSGYKEVIESAYDLPALSRAADFLSTMTYDYHGGWERATAHHTPLVPTQKDALPYYSIEYAIKSLISGGADPKKLLLGLSFYGQSYRLASAEGSNGPGSPAAGPGEPGEFTKQPGMLAYYEICYRVKNLRWKTGRQDKAGPYTYSDNQWVGYDDPKSIAEKVEWALGQGLGGVTAWAIDLDDFNNRCCAEPSPLLRAAGRALGRSVPSPPTSACERPPTPVTPSPPTTTTISSDGSSGGMGGGHDHNHGGHQTTATTSWPSWTEPTQHTTQSTVMVWWPPATTSTPATTTTRRTTTSRRPEPTTNPVPDSSNSLEGSPCEAGEYRSAPGDCTAYLQCSGGVWNKHRCAPGLHWSTKTNRCDWPSFAKCTESSNTGVSTATSTLAPTTSRPPPPPTTTRRTTTSTTTTPRTTTTQQTTASSAVGAEGAKEGGPCSGQDYIPVSNDCNSYLHCDGSYWRLQHCAPGLHWSPTAKHCDWPKYAKCAGSSLKPTTVYPKPMRTTTQPPTGIGMQQDRPSANAPCSSSDSLAAADTCDTYLVCVGGKWSKQLCPPGLHWDKRTRRCDWVEFAMCESKMMTSRAPQTQATPQTTMKPRPIRPTTTTTRRPDITDTEYLPVQPPTNCQTGTYHAHPRCEKFYVCVNGALITQSCAPGLVWRQDRTQCDFPHANSCSDHRQTSAPLMDESGNFTPVPEREPMFCENGAYAMYPNDCTRYRHCIFGKYEDFSCAAGLHWNEPKQICDWPKSAKCKTKSIPTTSKPSLTTKPTIPSHENHNQGTHVKPIASVPSSGTSTAVDSVGSKPALLKTPYKLVCYYTNWSWYRPGIGKFSPEDIDPSICTHIVYGFAVLGRDGLIEAHDTWADYDNQFYEKVAAYKRYGIKVSLALGGWNDSAGDKYSRLVNDAAARARFISHAVQFLEKHGFDGLDLDWEYPKCWQVDCSKGPDSDKDSFADLVRELSAVLKPKGLLLSSAVSPSKKVIDAGYDVPVLAHYLDWIGVMTYDYHGQWDKKTGHVAPLYYHPDDDNTYFNANYTIHYWMQKGAPPSKLVMGFPMYGQTFTLGTDFETNPALYERRNASGLNVPAVSGGEEGEYTRAKGFLSYYEICERIKHKNWQVVKDAYHRIGPYAYKGNQWVSFDDVEMINRKTNFIKSLNLAGGMVWAIDLDDFRNRCGEGKHPLMNAIKKGLLDSHIDVDFTPEVSDTKPETDLSDPNNEIGEDFDDIQVKPTRPSQHPSHGIQITPERPTERPQRPQINVDGVDNDIQVRPERPTQRPQRPTQRPQRPQMDDAVTTKRPTRPTTVNNRPEEKYKVVCYYTNWSWYRPDSGKFTPSDIDPSLCTHIVYAFAVLDKQLLIIKPYDTWLDVENKFFEKVVHLKSKGARVLLGLGGWNDSAGDKYSRLVNSPTSRRKFIIHALDFLKEHGFDGLDLDWEYPRCWQVNCDKGPSSDKQGFANLVKELKAAFAPRGLLVSAAVSASKRVIDAGYDVPTLSSNLDWISLMTYDYHGQWDKKTGHVAPMYASEFDDDVTFNVNFTVHYWMEKGAQKEKLVLGVPMYGQSFSIKENVKPGYAVPTEAGGEGGDETRARGFLAFYEICERIRVQGWEVHRDPGGRLGPYATKGDQWVSFDDDYMVRHKAEYVRSMGLGGSMVWSLDLDDFNGQHCGCGVSPLLRNINHVLRNKAVPPMCNLEEIKAPMMPPTQTEKPENENPETSTSLVTSGQTTAPPKVSDEIVSGSSMDGMSCSVTRFQPDESDCSKYYLCINGRYIQLSCPAPLHWNENHCDWPAKSNCKTRSQLRIASGEQKEVSHDKPILACYFTNWAYYRNGNGSFGPEQFDAKHCTHIIYSWAHLDDTFEIVPGNYELDVQNDFYGKLTSASIWKTNIKVIIGVGGLEDSESDKWSRLIASAENRKTFVSSAMKFLKKWAFDGLHLAWQYPVCKQAPCNSESLRLSEKADYSALLQELSKALRQHSLEFSVLVAASPEVAALAYDANVLATTADWLATSANDFYSASATSGKASYLVPLESENPETMSFKTLLSYWATLVPTRQLVIGVPAYARSYTLRSSSKQPGALVRGPGEPGPYTTVPGFLAYYEVCSSVKSGHWRETRTPDGTYAVSGSQWASYLRPEEVFSIAASAKRAGVRGAALWAVDLDDWRGECSCLSQPLLTSLREGLSGSSLPPLPCVE